MPPKLSEADGKAVDALLNRLDELHQQQEADPRRVVRLDELLGLLRAYPIGELPHNLVQRTMRYIRQANGPSSSGSSDLGQQPIL